jgi:hypothetical protein
VTKNDERIGYRKKVQLTLSGRELHALRSLVLRLNQAIAYNTLIEAEDLTTPEFEVEAWVVTQALEKNGYSPLDNTINPENITEEEKPRDQE